MTRLHASPPRDDRAAVVLAPLCRIARLWRHVLRQSAWLCAAVALSCSSGTRGGKTASTDPSGDPSAEPPEQPVVLKSQLPPAPTTRATSDPNAGRGVEVGPRPPDRVPPITLDTPPFTHSAPKPLSLPEAPPPALRQLQSKRNQITDDRFWFQSNGLEEKRIRAGGFRFNREKLPRGLPITLGQLRLVEIFEHGDHRILSFGETFAGGFVLALQRPDGHTLQVYDFSRYRRAPRMVPSDASFVDQLVQWAEARDGVLYVANGHRTYAKSSFNQNAYITAIDQETGELRWRSAPLVANSSTFLVKAGHIISGYGFTAEPDHLFLLDRNTGKTLRRVPLASGPSWLIEKDGKLFVRCYNTDYVFSL